MSEPYVRFENICKSYGKTEVIKDLNLSIDQGERLILLGPSGCGKSTTLRMIAGLESITSGALYFGGRKMNEVPAGKRQTAMVFQDYALYPHMTVEKNISYGLKINKVDGKEISRRVEKVVSMLHLNGLERRFPRDLSGGQRQRVALARAIAKQSPIFLLDEPLSNLDAQMRITARKELLNIHQLYHHTFIYVTHDQVEAMALGNRIALMNQGVLQMLDTPYHIYHHPVNVFAAKFIGAPSANLLDVRYDDQTFYFKKTKMRAESYWLPLIEKSAADRFLLGIRPEHISLSKTRQENSLPGSVSRTEEYGERIGVIFQFEGMEMTAISDNRSWQKGDIFYFSIDQKEMFLFDKETTVSIGYPILEHAAIK